jgi:hypothetical protein
MNDLADLLFSLSLSLSLPSTIPLSPVLNRINTSGLWIILAIPYR